MPQGAPPSASLLTSCGHDPLLWQGSYISVNDDASRNNDCKNCTPACDPGYTKVHSLLRSLAQAVSEA